MMYELITYGAGDKFWDFFNGLAAVVGDSSYISIVQIASLFAFTMVVFEIAFKIQIKSIIHWFLAFFITFNVMLVPKVDLLITDRAMGDRQYVVSNTPFGLALFVDTFSQIGDTLTSLTESVFTLPNDLKYHQSGTLMAASLMETASRFQITSPSMSKNLDGFMQQCVQYDILLGKYRLDDIFNEGNLWALFKSNPSNARAFLYDEEITTCATGIEKLTEDWNEELKRAEQVYGQRFFGESEDPAAYLMRYLPVSYQYMGNLSTTAADIMQQNMLINAFHDSILNHGAQVSASAAVESYASARALQQQRAAYGISGRLATHALPLLKSVIEVLVYGCFLLIFPLMLLPNSWSIIKNYILTLFWVQSWGPLYAVLNLFLNLDARNALIGLMESPVFELSAITIANLPGIEQVASDRALMAAYLSMFIPVISFSLIMTGKAYFPLLATQIAGTTQSATQHGAEEATSGNYSLGNLSLYNDNAYNASAFHTNRNLSYGAGMLSLQTQEGGQIIHTPDNTTLVDNTQSISKLNTSMNLSGRISGALSESYEETMSRAETQTVAAYKTMTQAARDVYEIGEAHATSHYNDSQWSTSRSAGINQSAVDYKNHIDSLMKAEHWSQDQAIQASAGLSLGFNAGGSGAHMGLSTNAGHAERESWDASSQYTDQRSTQQMLESALRAEHSGSEKHTGEHSIRSNESESTSFDEAIGLRDEASEAFTQSESIRKALSKVNEDAVGINTKGDQILLQALKENINPETGKRYTEAEIAQIDARDPKLMKGLSDAIAKKLADELVKNPDVDPSALLARFEHNAQKTRQTVEKNVKDKHKHGKALLKEKEALEKIGENPLNYEPSQEVKKQYAKVTKGINQQNHLLEEKQEQQQDDVKKQR